MRLHIDVETYSSINIFSSGSYKYTQSIDFEILMVAYAFDYEPVKVIDLTLPNSKLPKEFLDALYDPNVEKHAYNAAFERYAFQAIGHDIPIDQWYCSLVKAACCGWPLGLQAVSNAMGLGDKAKFSTGKALIRYFSVPCKPTKANGKRNRNLRQHNPEKWNEFMDYCVQDVEAEREIYRRISHYDICDFERRNYILDQQINDRGILVDLEMASNAYSINLENIRRLTEEIKEITGLDNPNSPLQLTKWLSKATGKEIKSIAKDKIQPILDEVGEGPVVDVLNIRRRMSKSSIKKYVSMHNCANEDNRVRGLFQFYGANRTGRWAGRLVQMQNLPRNYLKKIEDARELAKSGDYDRFKDEYPDVSNTLSQLIRTAFWAPEGYTFSVADFSAIEARVTAWLADERWRIDVFETHGKIYEASASMMFNVPIESVTKGSELRDKGKIAELALGYQGALGALRKMGGEKMGLSDDEMKSIVSVWRNNNKNIVKLWRDVESAAKKCVRLKRKIIATKRRLVFDYDGDYMTIELPSGRKLSYVKPGFGLNMFGKESLEYEFLDQKTKKWVKVGTYGGKLIENIVQAISRDILAYSMQSLDDAGFKIVMHVHDEAICEVPLESADESLETMCEIMGDEIPWAQGLPLGADGYVTPFYKKD